MRLDHREEPRGRAQVVRQHRTVRGARHEQRTLRGEARPGRLHLQTLQTQLPRHVPHPEQRHRLRVPRRVQAPALLLPRHHTFVLPNRSLGGERAPPVARGSAPDRRLGSVRRNRPGVVVNTRASRVRRPRDRHAPRGAADDAPAAVRRPSARRGRRERERAERRHEGLLTLRRVVAPDPDRSVDAPRHQQRVVEVVHERQRRDRPPGHPRAEPVQHRARLVIPHAHDAAVVGDRRGGRDGVHEQTRGRRRLVHVDGR